MASIKTERPRLETELINVSDTDLPLDLPLIVQAVAKSLAVDLYDDHYGGTASARTPICGALTPDEQFTLLALLAGLVNGRESEFADAARLVSEWQTGGDGVDSAVKALLDG